MPPFFAGEGRAGSSSTMWPGSRPTFVPSGILIHPAVRTQQTWAEIWGAVPLRGGAGSTSNNESWAEAYLRTKWHLDPSSRLAKIRGCDPLFGRNTPTSQTGQTDRQDRQRSASIERTVLQTVAQND